jgi:hypothetical protein
MDGRGAAGYRLARKRDRRRFRGSGPRPASTTFGGSTGAFRADVKFTAGRDLGRDRVVLAAGFDAEHPEPAVFVVEDGALDETDHIYDLKISPSRWIELSTRSCGNPGHWQRMMK